MNINDDILAAINSNQPLEQTSIPTGFVLISEWMSQDGGRWLTMASGNASGDDLPTWQIQGYLHSSLFDGFPADEEE